MERNLVLIADDHDLFRRGVASVLAEGEGLEVVGEACNGQEAVQKAQELAPDIVIMDLSMPVMGGLEATAEILKKVPGAMVLIVTASEEEADLYDALQRGARGYILKGARPQELVQAVQQVALGWVIVSPPLAGRLLSEFKEKALPPSGLSEREQEILGLAARGLSNQEIAEALTISINTVKTHFRNILDKLHLKSRSQAAAYGAQLGGGGTEGENPSAQLQKRAR